MEIDRITYRLEVDDKFWPDGFASFSSVSKTHNQRVTLYLDREEVSSLHKHFGKLLKGQSNSKKVK